MSRSSRGGKTPKAKSKFEHRKPLCGRKRKAAVKNKGRTSKKQ